MWQRFTRAIALLLLLVPFYHTARGVAQRSSLRRERLLRPEFGNSLSLLHSSFLPQGEVANRISGNERIRGFGAVTGRSANPFLPDRRDSIIKSKAAAALGAGIASLAGWVIDSPQFGSLNKQNKRPQGPGSDINKTPKTPQSQCSKAAEQLFKIISNSFITSNNTADTSNNTNSSSSSSSSSGDNSSSVSFLAQPGYIDFGMAGSQDSQAPCQPNCAFSNPTSSYGLTVLPLNPSEDLAAKVADEQTPEYVKENLDGHYGAGMAPTWQLQPDEVVLIAGCTPPGDASRYFGVTGYLYSTHSNDSNHWINVFASMGDSASIATISSAAAASSQQQQQQGHDKEDAAAASMDASDEFQITSGRLKTSNPISNNSSRSTGSRSKFEALTVVLQGANPTTVTAAAKAIRASITAAASAATEYDANNREPATPASANKQDYINIIPIPGPVFSDAIGLNTTSNYYTLIVRNIAPSNAEGPAAFEGYVEHPHIMAWRLTPVSANSSSSSSAGYSRSSSYNLPQVIPRVSTSNNIGIPQQVYLSVGSQNDSSSSSNPRAANSSTATAAASRAHSTINTSNSTINTRFNCRHPANKTSAACLLHLHVAAAVAAGVSDAISRLLVAQPAIAESLRGTGYADDGSDQTQEPPNISNNSSSSSADAGHTISSTARNNTTTKALAADAEFSSNKAGSPTGLGKQQRQQQQVAQQQVGPTLQQQQQMLDMLLTAIDLRYNGSYAIAHGLGSAAPLALLGVDWGLDCMVKTLDWCNGDNRDATYLSSLPLFTLNRPGQLLLVVGVNYVTAGAGSYMNVAVTDPVEQLGLEAFDDVELAAAALPWPVAAVPPAPDSGEDDYHRPKATVDDDVLRKLMYLVAFSRNCTGIAIPCKEVAPGSRSRGAPLSRPLMTISRVYVNPSTGVGPDPHDLIPFMTLLLTPKTVAVPADYVPRTDMNAWQGAFQASFKSTHRNISDIHSKNDMSGSNNSMVARKGAAENATSKSYIMQNSSSVALHTDLGGDVTAETAGGTARLPSTNTSMPRLLGLARPSFRSPIRQPDHQRLEMLRLQSSKPQRRSIKRWSNARGDFDPAAAAQATQCPVGRPMESTGTAETFAGSSSTASSSSDDSRNVVVFDGQALDNDKWMTAINDASSLVKQASYSNSSASDVVTTAVAAGDPCVRALVGMSQCSGKGSPDVCCSYVQTWNAFDCWCQASGKLLLSSMPAVLTPSVLQLLSWVCEVQ